MLLTFWLYPAERDVHLVQHRLIDPRTGLVHLEPETLSLVTLELFMRNLRAQQRPFPRQMGLLAVRVFALGLGAEVAELFLRDLVLESL